jgi:3-oxoacyl-[acyl-carrier-protein] synthase-3
MSSPTTPAGHITGWGTAVPEKILTNDDLAQMMDTSDEWIRERTGIRTRHVGGLTSTLAIEAGRKALDEAGVDGADVDLVIVATTTPDQLVPGTSATVHHELGIGGGAMDVNAACSGFVYSLTAAYGMLGVGYRRVLVIGADSLSRFTDWTDRGTAILFADGAGAVLLEQGPEPTLLGFDLGADGSVRHILECDHGGLITMEGREVFKRAVRVVVSSAQKAVARAGVGIDDIAFLVPHQANIRIIEAAAERLGISMERTCTVLDHTGNTSAGSIPLALVEAVEDGRIQPGQLLLLSGFGAGMTWASAVVRWQP